MKRTTIPKFSLIIILLLLCRLLLAQNFSDLPILEKNQIGRLVATRTAVPVGIAKFRLRGSNAHVGNLFGFSVAVSGDTVVVASHGYWNHPGGAYVFVKPATGWQDMTETAELTGTGWQGAVGFSSVAISGNTIIAGPSVDGFGAYIFEKPSGGWVNMTQTATLNVDQQLGTVFSVALSGNTAVLGYANGDQAGVAAVFARPSGGWHDMTQTAILTASDGQIGDQLGTSVAIDGNTVVVGAPFATINSVWAGALYVFVRPASGWSDMTQSAKLTPPHASHGQLGYSASINSNSIVSSADGSVYLFARPETGWADMTPTAALSPPNGQALIGCAAISGDVVVAGSTGPYPQNYGEVYAFLKPQRGWQTTSSPNAYYSGNPSAGPQELGYSIAVSGTKAVAGAAWFDNGVGAAYVFAPRQ